jgi:predicted phosphodiesterase
MNKAQHRPRLTDFENSVVLALRSGWIPEMTDSGERKPLRDLPSEYKKGNRDNVLIIGDIHEPFSYKGYLEFCREQQEKFECGTVVFIGDVIDSHFSSFHISNPDGYGAGEELDRAVDKIAEWNSVFPKAYVTIGNHDRMSFRKAESGGISKRWIKNYHEVLQTPGWDFVEEIVLHGVNYNHGEGGTARLKMKNEFQSQVQGHIHTQAYIEWSFGDTHACFGMQVGAGVDRNAYALAYAKMFKKQALSCGVVLDKGQLPILIKMPLEIKE